MSNYTNEESAAPINGKKEDDQNHTKSKLPTTQISTRFDPIQRIKEGFNYFKVNELDKQPEYYNKLEEKQEPKFLIFACSDSRVCPTNILNLRPGEALMARNIANMVPAVNQLKDLGVGSIIQAASIVFKVEVIMVIGHRRCGGIHRLINLPNEEPHDLIDKWLTIGHPVLAKVIKEHPNASDEQLHILVEKESLRNSLVNLLSYPYVRSRVADKKLKLMGGYYDFMCGKFEILEFDYDKKKTYNRDISRTQGT